MGDGEDLQIYHDGSNSYISEVGTGNLQIQSANAIEIESDTGEKCARFHPDGAVELYYDNVKQFETLSNGVRLKNGHLQLNETDHMKAIFGASDDLQIFHNGTDSKITNTTGNLIVTHSDGIIRLDPKTNENGILIRPDGAVELFYDNSKKAFTYADGLHIDTGVLRGDDNAKIALGSGTNGDLRIYHDGTSSAIENHFGDLKISTTFHTGINLITHSNHFAIKCLPNSQVELYYDNSKKFETTSDGVSVTGRMMVGTTSGSDALVVDGGSDAGTILTNSTNSNGNMMTFQCSGTSKFFIGSAGSFMSGHSGTTNQGIRAEGALAIATGGTTERMRIDSSGNVGIGTTSPDQKLYVQDTSQHSLIRVIAKNDSEAGIDFGDPDDLDIGRIRYGNNGNYMRFYTNTAERMRITSDGSVLVGTTSTTVESLTSAGSGVKLGGSAGKMFEVASNAEPAVGFNRTGDDGTIVRLIGQGSLEGTITVSGSAVSYNGGHLSRWSQFKGLSTTDKSARPTIYQGTVLSNLDDLCVWEGEDNQQLNMTKISDVVGDKDVAGVFFTWDDDDDKVVNDFYVAMTGDLVIRVAASTTVARGDLLISAGDGTAKPQADDIVRSSTIAKIISTNHTATYPDGSKAYPCVLMAC
tara:strand:- start:517 stop:2436 length:1920 start_codon:yes stop_codon:yes gene_type:complete